MSKAEMEMSPSQLIDAKIKGLGGWRGNTLTLVRQLIREADPAVVEAGKWSKRTNRSGVGVGDAGGRAEWVWGGRAAECENGVGQLAVDGEVTRRQLMAWGKKLRHEIREHELTTAELVYGIDIAASKGVSGASFIRGCVLNYEGPVVA